jgi:hypothetical protein
MTRPPRACFSCARYDEFARKVTASGARSERADAFDDDAGVAELTPELRRELT